MIALEILGWWYGQGWMQAAKNAEARLIKVSHLFSVPILVRTLFAPWRRIITYPGASIDARVRALGDNLVSRCVGFSVRCLVLLTAGLMLALLTLVQAVELVAWPLLPVAGVVALVLGVLG